MNCNYWLPRDSYDLNHIFHELPVDSWGYDKGFPVSLTWDLIDDSTVLSSSSLITKFLIGADSNESGEFPLSNGEVIPNFFAVLALIKLASVTSSATPGSLSTADICVLSVCAREYNISMASGILQLEIVSTSYSNLAKDDVDQTPTFRSAFEARMRDVLQEILEGELFLYGEAPGDRFFPAVANMLPTGLNASSDIPKTMERIAAAMTNRLRDMSSHKVQGLSGSMELYVRVSWLWLLLPGFSVTFGTLLLVAVMITTRKHKLPIWKTSELALLFHGLDFQVGNTVKMHRASEMEDLASALQVRLGRNSDGTLKLERKSE